MTDFIADIALASEPEPKPRKRGGPKWYTTHAPGWQPEADDITLAPRALAACNANQAPSLRYAPSLVVEEKMSGAKLYYPGWGVLWEYRGTFLSHGSTRFYEVMVLNTIPGCGIRIGSVWAAEAGKFRRVK